MARRVRTGIVLPVLLVAVLLGAGGGSGQAEQPEWGDDLLAELDGWADEYNVAAGTGKVEFPGHWLVRDQRVNLYVEAADGSEAVYSFTTDERLRVAELEQGERDDATLHVRTTKATLERVASEADRAAAVRRALVSREIRVERVLRLPAGLTLVVGVPEVVVGVVGVVTAALALAKVGVGGAASIQQAATSRALATVRRAIGPLRSTVEANRRALLQLYTALSALDLFGVVDVTKAGRTLRRRLIALLVRVARRVRSWVRREDPVDRGQSSPRQEEPSRRESQ
jgi:hypothetical protein